MALNQVTLLLDTFSASGQLITAGQAFIAPTAQLVDTTDHLFIWQTPQAISLIPPPGSPASWLASVALYSTDSSNLVPPPGISSWKYSISYSSPAAPVGYTFSLAAAGTFFSFTATNASPCVFTAAGSAYTAGQAVSLFGAGLPAGFTAGTPYYIVSPSGTSFSLAATPGGAAIASTSTGTGTVVTCQYLSALSP